MYIGFSSDAVAANQITDYLDAGRPAASASRQRRADRRTSGREGARVAGLARSDQARRLRV